MSFVVLPYLSRYKYPIRINERLENQQHLAPLSWMLLHLLLFRKRFSRKNFWLLPIILPLNFPFLTLICEILCRRVPWISECLLIHLNDALDNMGTLLYDSEVWSERNFLAMILSLLFLYQRGNMASFSCVSFLFIIRVFVHCIFMLSNTPVRCLILAPSLLCCM